MSAGAPNSAVLDLASVRERALRLVPTAEVLPSLARRFGEGVYHAMRIRGGTYPRVTDDVGVVGHYTVLVADARLDDDVVYEITRVLFERKADLVAVHPAAKELAPRTAAAGSPAPFHPGAARYYREIGALGA